MAGMWASWETLHPVSRAAGGPGPREMGCPRLSASRAGTTAQTPLGWLPHPLLRGWKDMGQEPCGPAILLDPLLPGSWTYR